jgi:hypothetical protein
MRSMLTQIDLGPRLDAYAIVAFLTTPQRGHHAYSVDIHDGATHALIPMSEVTTSTLVLLSERMRTERFAQEARRLRVVFSWRSKPTPRSSTR